MRPDTFPRTLLDRARRPNFTDGYRKRWKWANGTGQTLEPNRHFASGWYAWQNPDSDRFSSPFDHYLQVGLGEGRDPSPFVDFGKLRRTTAIECSNQELYAELLRTDPGPSRGVYRNVAELRSIQATFLESIVPLVLADRRAQNRPYLVFVQNRCSPLIREWMSNPDRSFDVLNNYYSADCVDSSDGDCVVFQPGTKFTAMRRLAQLRPDLLHRYRYMLFIDDDIDVDGGGLDRMFAECEKLSCPLAQASLDYTSHCVWPVMKVDRSARRQNLQVNTVEIMMPVISGDLFWRSIGYFDQSISGFGLDLLWAKLLEETGSAYRIGSVVAHHGKSIDQTGGAYYEFLRAHHINAKSELWAMMSEFELGSSIHATV